VTRCLVTDRRRLCPDADSFAAARACLVEQARRAAAAGVDLIQIRERDLESAALAALVAEVVAVTRESSTRVVVNDRIDVALAAGADGVHLRGDSVPVDGGCSRRRGWSVNRCTARPRYARRRALTT